MSEVLTDDNNWKEFQLQFVLGHCDGFDCLRMAR